jgi:uncharacterized protein (TIGR02231 family)
VSDTELAAKPVSAPIVAVTVLEDRAAVTRRATTTVAAGQHRFVIEGVAPVLADKTLIASATGARVLDVRCERFIAPWREPGSDAEPAKLRAEWVVRNAERADADARARTATGRADGLAQVVAAAWHDLAIAATRGVRVDPTATARLAELDAGARAAAARAAEAKLDSELAASAIERLHVRIARAEAEAGIIAARLVVDIVVDGDAAAGERKLDLELGYVVPCAAWRPHHRAALVAGGERVDFQTTACVWQATGEDWPGCALTFSLERASLGVEPPDLGDDVLRTRRRPEVVTVQARDQEVQTTGLGGAAVVPGIDDHGLGLVLRGARPMTIRADGTPHRVAISEFSAPAQVSLVAMPPVSPWVHLRAKFANTGTAPLLAGPVDLIMSSGYVGRGEVDFVAAGEQVELGFGPEPDVRIHRDERQEHDPAGLLGTWNVRSVKVAVRLSNLGAKRREVIVTERVPVSEVEQVEIAVAGPRVYKVTEAGSQQVVDRAIDDRGIVTWTVELPPHARRVVTLAYDVKSRKDVAGA